MNVPEFIDTARTLIAADEGLLAMDESNPARNIGFARLGIPQSVQTGRAYRTRVVTICNWAARRGEYSVVMESA